MMTQSARVDIVVIGAGHAGCEAALAASRLGARVALVTLRRDRIAYMSCNPAVGGVGKGHLVREIDALGGAMARVADATGIQFRRLNMSRGPAVRSTRAQSDSKRYCEAMSAIIAGEANIRLVENEAVELRTDRGQITGVELVSGQVMECRAAIVTTGTFLNGLCHVGAEQFAGGRIGDQPARHLSAALKRLGLTLGRFKTGTTPRLAQDSIAWGALEVQWGDEPPPRFAFEPGVNELRQVACHITHTNADTHNVIRNNLHRSPLYQGVIKGRGPRYCPSIEDKVVRFADKERHQIFLEPEGLDSDRIYPNGMSTSLPRDVQDAFLRTIAGLEAVRVIQHGYAVEYDYVPPTQLFPSLMTKVQPGLFLAGQINGTSGYEEAAAQGLMAGLNATRYLADTEPAVLDRGQAYIGVLIDDLVTKGVDEPYRLFTARAEYRLTLREANAEERLWRLAAAWGLIDQGRQIRAQARGEVRVVLRESLEKQVLGAEQASALGLNPSVYGRQSRAQILRRPDMHLDQIVDAGSAVDADTGLFVEEEIKYAGYIERERRNIERLSELDRVRLPTGFDYHGTAGLSREVQEKLSAVQPTTLGQASRIPGITPVALALLRVQARRLAGA